MRLAVALIVLGFGLLIAGVAFAHGQFASFSAGWNESATAAPYLPRVPCMFTPPKAPSCNIVHRRGEPDT